MRDKELSEWTCQGPKSGFFVATFEGKVVGTVAYKIKVHLQNSLLHLLLCFIQEKEMEICRASTDKKHRNFGIASKLMNRMDECAFELDCETL